MSEYYKFKIVLIGPGAVGKTSILNRFVHQTFSERYELTIGVNFLTKEIELKNQTVKLAIWDIGGQKRFKFMRNRFFEGANGALLVFDLSRAQTFTEIKQWLSSLYQFSGKNVPFILIGNKIDLIEEIGEVVDRAKAKKYAEKEKSVYIETSAKTGANVEDSFLELTRRMIKD